MNKENEKYQYKKYKQQNLLLKSKKGANTGITLIALVITIIVLLILAAVSIATLTGENGILTQANNAKTQTVIGEEKEKIQLSITDVVSQKFTNNDTSNIKRSEIEAALEKNSLDNEVTVSDRRPGEEYQYIITVGKNKYGIKSNNEVEVIQSAILNQYIEVTEVTESTPTYLFKNTITQEDVDGEANASNISYSIIGVSTSQDGDYVSSGDIEGKSGYLSIVDLQQASFRYTLNNFFQDDEIFYVKIQIGNDLEKIQKLTVLQGDVVKYEENFSGIEYNGEWSDIEDEHFSGGTAKYCEFSENVNHYLLFNCYGNCLDYLSMINETSRYN